MSKKKIIGRTEHMTAEELESTTTRDAFVEALAKDCPYIIRVQKENEMARYFANTKEIPIDHEVKLALKRHHPASVFALPVKVGGFSDGVAKNAAPGVDIGEENPTTPIDTKYRVEIYHQITDSITFRLVRVNESLDDVMEELHGRKNIHVRSIQPIAENFIVSAW